MKIFNRCLPILLAAICLCSLLRTTPSVSAAATPVLVLDSTTATAPTLDHKLDLVTYGSGGPFTVTFEWKCSLTAISSTAPDAYASVQIIGTKYGTMTEQPESGIRISGNTGWTKVSYTFQNVGTYPVGGSNMPGNLLRFQLHDAKGQLYIKNLQIKPDTSTVLYSLNNDFTVQELVSQMESTGLTKADISELAAINYDCLWTVGQYGSGNYTSYIILDGSTVTSTTSTIARPTTASTTKSTTASTTTPTTIPTTAKPTTATTTKPTTVPTTKPTTIPTTKPTTVKPSVQNPCASGHHYQNGFCIYCAKADPYYNPCAKGHTFQNGFCVYCLAEDPFYDPCAGGHTYENGWCVYCSASDPSTATTQPVITQDPCAVAHGFVNGFCVRCAKTDLSFNPCESGHTFLGAGCISCGAEAPAPASRLLPILLVIGAGLSGCAVLLILILRKKN